MKLRHYIKGSRKGKEANRLERQAMTDPFLAEALEGYERMPDAHVERIDVMRKRISANTRKRHKTIYTWSMAASIIVVFGLGGYFLLHKTDHPIQTQIAREDQIEQILPAKPENAIALNQREESAPPPPPATSSTEDTVVEVQEHSEEIAAPAVMAADTDITIPQMYIPEEEAETEFIVSHPVIGDTAYLEYLKKNKVNPTDKECEDVKGRVVISFLVNEKGRPYDLKIVRSLCPSLDKEAIRLIENGPDWTEGNQLMHLPVAFE